MPDLLVRGPKYYQEGNLRSGKLPARSWILLTRSGKLPKILEIFRTSAEQVRNITRIFGNFSPSETDRCSKLIFRYFAVKNQGNKDFFRWIRVFRQSVYPCTCYFFTNRSGESPCNCVLIVCTKWVENFDNLEFGLETVLGYAGAESL